MNPRLEIVWLLPTLKTFIWHGIPLHYHIPIVHTAAAVGIAVVVVVGNTAAAAAADGVAADGTVADDTVAVATVLADFDLVSSFHYHSLVLLVLYHSSAFVEGLNL